jgi:hypothetical protein
MEYIQKRMAEEDQVKAALVFKPHKEDAAKYPALLEFLTGATWDDGSVRVLGTALLFAEDGRIKCCLNDKDGGMVGFRVLGSLTVALAEIERALCERDVEWRRRREDVPRKR